MSTSTPGSDSDLDDLPDLSEIFPTGCQKIKPGDIVWARFKKLHWPAFVTNIVKKKRVHFWFTDLPSVIFKAPLSKVYPFKSAKSEEFRREAQIAGCGSQHDEVQSNAAIYINRKLEGYNDDPKKFFDPTYPFLLVEEYLKNNPNASRESLSSLKIPHILNRSYIREAMAAESKLEKESPKALVQENDIEAGSDDSSDYDTESYDLEDCEFNTFSDQTSDLSPEESMYVKDIVNCIKSGRTDAYLFDILNGKIQSFYYEFFKKCSTSNKSLLDYIFSGPVKNLDDVREILFFLISLFDKVKQTASTSTLDNSNFITRVWLPESIIFAISEVKQIELQEAAELFNQTSRLKSVFLNFVENSIDTQNNIDNTQVNKAMPRSKIRGRKGLKKRIFENPTSDDKSATIPNECSVPNSNVLKDVSLKSSETSSKSCLSSRSKREGLKRRISEDPMPDHKNATTPSERSVPNSNVLETLTVVSGDSNEKSSKSSSDSCSNTKSKSRNKQKKVSRHRDYSPEL